MELRKVKNMIHILEHTVIHALKDNIGILPFLFLTYCVMEYLEKLLSEKSEGAVRFSGKMGPLWGGILGLIPQCGFSAAAASFYSGGVITLGTMLAIFLSTSDEMLPILISAAVPVKTIGSILAAKVLVSVLGGFAVDAILRKYRKSSEEPKCIHDLCEQEGCHCKEKHSIWKSALLHTVKVFGFVLLASVGLNLVLELGGDTALERFATSHRVLEVLLVGIVGLVPNCAASVLITQLYLNRFIHAGAMMAGLLASAGVGVLVLFKTNRPLKENIKIVGILYTIGILAGVVIDLLCITF